MDIELRKKVISDKLNLFKAFAKHSTKGVKCNKCGRFVPNSWKVDDGLFCPYIGCGADCISAEPMKHPISFVKRSIFSMNQPVTPEGVITNKSSNTQKEIGDFWCNGDGNAYDKLSEEEEYRNKFKIVKDTIYLQKRINGGTRKMPNKMAMYEAFENALSKYPKEMINYLTVGGQIGDIAIQAIIFQEFAKCMIDKLPIQLWIKGDEVYINSPLDQRLHLFNGIREFTTYLDENLQANKRQQFIIENDTRTKDTEISFIGKIISVHDIAGNDLTDIVDIYNFGSVRLKYTNKIKTGKDVVIRYYSIQPSYTMGSMIHMQRIKKRLKDSIAKKIS